jgi:O-antigen/teichoic acid export membrane protein
MRSSNGFYNSLGWLLFLNLLIKPFWIFGIDRQVQNEIGATAYGLYFSLYNFTFLFGFLLDWGITSYLNRQLAVKEEFASKAGSFLTLKLFFILTYAVFVLMMAMITSSTNWSVLLPLIAIQGLSSLFLFFRAIVTARQKFATDSWLSVLDKLLMIVVCGTFLFLPAIAGPISLQKFLLAQVACTIIAIGITLVILSKDQFHLTIDYTLPGKRVLPSALPFAVIVLLMSIHYRFDGFLLAKLEGEKEAGLYAAAYRLLDAANMPGYLVASFLLPFISRHKDSPGNCTPAILVSRHLLILLSLGIMICTFFLAPWGQQILYHTTDVKAIDLLKWCLPALVGYSLVHVYGTVLTATGHISAFCVITLFAVIINISLNFLLIPSAGARGSAMAALISQGCCGITSFLYASKKCKLPPDARSWLFYTFIAAILTGCLYLFNKTSLHPVLQLLAVTMILLSSAVFWIKRMGWKKKNLFTQ